MLRLNNSFFNLTRLKGQFIRVSFIKITKHLTKQDRALVREWQDKAARRKKKRTKRDLQMAHGVGCTLKRFFFKYKIIVNKISSIQPPRLFPPTFCLEQILKAILESLIV